MPTFTSSLAAVALAASLNVLSIGLAGAQSINPNVSAGIGQGGQPTLNQNVFDRLCDVRTGRDCVRKPSATPQQRTNGPQRQQQQGGGPRPSRR